MQTFLPFPGFPDSAGALDNRRLNKQLVEVQQILTAHVDPAYGWQHHPNVNMWRGYRVALCEYGLACYAEWQRRFDEGLRGGVREHKSGEFIRRERARCVGPLVMPPWMGGVIHEEHRARLVEKDPVYYEFLKGESDD